MEKPIKLYIDTSVWNLALETERKFDCNLTNNFLINIQKEKQLIFCISDFIISWNFKHIVRARTIRGVHRINFNEGFGLIEIVTPREYLGI